MGQVPENTVIPPILILGHGRVAKHFSYYLSSQQVPIIQWARASAITPLAQLIEKHQPKIGLVLIQDSAIEPFIESHSELHSLNLIHFSGCLSTSHATGMHPLMSFGPNLYEPAFYEKIPFICEKGQLQFSDIFPEFKNPTYTIEQKDKALYHALCVLAGNFSVILWQKLFKDFESRLEIPAGAAHPYLEQITRNLLAHPHLALTGPLQRRDQITVEKNLSALQDDAFQSIYQAFREMYV